MTKSVEILQSVLADLLDLGLVSKQAHWNITGANFLPVHTHLDVVYTQALASQDLVAERITALKGFPDGRAATVAATSSLAAAPAGEQKDGAVVKNFAKLLEDLSATISGKFGDLEGDLATQDILIGIVAGLDKDAWFFRSQKA
ncbi:MAG: DNA starvation/stationary phase protection protein [Propionibacteriaceae bacterium]|nr:DNA starvation/stationary phase protection protein [Propionibacteriaceae bacterium]